MIELLIQILLALVILNILAYDILVILKVLLS